MFIMTTLIIMPLFIPMLQNNNSNSYTRPAIIHRKQHTDPFCPKENMHSIKTFHRTYTVQNMSPIATPTKDISPHNVLPIVTIIRKNPRRLKKSPSYLILKLYYTVIQPRLLERLRQPKCST